MHASNINDLDLLVSACFFFSSHRLYHVTISVFVHCIVVASLLDCQFVLFGWLLAFVWIHFSSNFYWARISSSLVIMQFRSTKYMHWRTPDSAIKKSLLHSARHHGRRSTHEMCAFDMKMKVFSYLFDCSIYQCGSALNAYKKHVAACAFCSKVTK